MVHGTAVSASFGTTVEMQNTMPDFRHAESVFFDSISRRSADKLAWSATPVLKEEEAYLHICVRTFVIYILHLGPVLASPPTAEKTEGTPTT